MRLTKDNYELIMFDLLEGNIPEGEVDAIVQQIDQDEFLRREWELFQATVVQPEQEIVYTQKDDLIKSERKIIPMGGWITIGVAASLFLGLIVFSPWKQDLTEIAGELPVEEITAPTQAEGTTPIIADAEEMPRDVQDALVNDLPERRAILPVHHKAEQEEAELPTPYSAELIVTDLNSKTSTEGLAAYSLDFESPDYVATTRNIDTDVTSNQLERMTGKATMTMRKLSKPEVRFKPDWENRRFDLEVETYGYHAMASVSPFNK